MISIDLMTPPDVSHWNQRIWNVYCEELMRSGMPEALAKVECSATKESTFPNGILAKGNFLLKVRLDEENIGNVWLVEKGNAWFIYDIEIIETRRREGLGRKTMHLIEEFVRERDGVSINLSVFEFNQIAKKLYESEGFATVRTSMKKNLE